MHFQLSLIPYTFLIFPTSQAAMSGIPAGMVAVQTASARQRVLKSSAVRPPAPAPSSAAVRALICRPTAPTSRAAASAPSSAAARTTSAPPADRTWTVGNYCYLPHRLPQTPPLSELVTAALSELVTLQFIPHYDRKLKHKKC